MPTSDVAAFIRQLRRAGYGVVMGGGGHWKVWDGDRLVTTVPNSPTCHRWRLNSRSDIRRWEKEKETHLE